MLRKWNIVTVSLLAAVALAFTPHLARGQDVTAKDIKDLKDSIELLAKKVDDNNGNVVKSLMEVNKDMMAIQQKLQGPVDSAEDAKFKQALQAAFKALDDRMAALKADVDKLKATQQRISQYPSSTTGRILLVNNYPEALLFVVNNQNYRVAPNTTLPLENQPAGAFVYEVISGTYGSVTPNGRQAVLEAGNIYTITVR